MRVSDWPRPVRRAIYWSIFAAVTALCFAPAAVLLTTLISLLQSRVEISWLRLLGGYATLISAPIAAVITAATVRGVRNPPRYFSAYALFGGMMGILVGVLLGIITGGYSLLSAPVTGYLTAITLWLIRRPDRDVANPATSAP